MILFIGHVYGHSSDSTEILQLCLNLEELQTYFPKEDDGTMKPVILMKRDVVFPQNLSVLKFGYPIIQMTRDQIVNESIETFFMFHSFEIRDKIAVVKFGVVHGSPKHPKLIDIILEVKTTGEIWEVGDKTLK